MGSRLGLVLCSSLGRSRTPVLQQDAGPLELVLLLYLLIPSRRLLRIPTSLVSEQYVLSWLKKPLANR